MKTTKLASFTLNLLTIEMLNEYSKLKSINKSALIDRLVKEYIDRETEKYLFEPENKIPLNVLNFLKKHIKITTWKK